MTDSLKERLRGSYLELEQIARQDYTQENPETGDAFYSEGQSLMLAAAHIDEALARIEELEGELKDMDEANRMLVKSCDERKATIAKLEGRIEELEATDWHEVYLKTAEKNKRLVAERDEAHEAVIQHCARIKELEAKAFHLATVAGEQKITIAKLLDRAIEEMAKLIYDRMPFDGVGAKPTWVERGNSLKQDEARREARSILSDL